MRKLRIPLTILTVALCCQGAWAAFCVNVAPSTENPCYILSCQSYYYYGNGSYCSCATCNSGYTRTNGGTQSAGTCDYDYYYCQSNCTGCANCTSDADWSAYGTGYQKKTTKSCSCNTCNSSTTYRCAAGYYGTSTNGTSGCTICPIGGTSVAGDNTTISKCYASPPNGSDYSGNWQFMQTCYYTSSFNENPIITDPGLVL
ncbi:MAG: hypothetical protein LBD50_00165 [Rickettsiales bacterium]|nr:hypothetical protein [Rickettsiales bacterium]